MGSNIVAQYSAKDVADVLANDLNVNEEYLLERLGLKGNLDDSATVTVVVDDKGKPSIEIFDPNLNADVESISQNLKLEDRNYPGIYGTKISELSDEEKKRFHTITVLQDGRFQRASLFTIDIPYGGTPTVYRTETCIAPWDTTQTEGYITYSDPVFSLRGSDACEGRPIGDGVAFAEAHSSTDISSISSTMIVPATDWSISLSPSSSQEISALLWGALLGTEGLLDYTQLSMELLIVYFQHYDTLVDTAHDHLEILNEGK